MQLKAYILGLTFATIVAWGAFGFVLFFIDPDNGILAVLSLYITLALALTGTFTVIGYKVRVLVSHGEQLYVNLGVSLRQGVFLAIAASGLLFLQSFRMLNWWDGALLIGFLILLEFFFLSRK